MKNLTQVNLVVNGSYRGSMFCPRIDNINSIDYNYDSGRKLTKIDLRSDTLIPNLDDIIGSLATNLPKGSTGITVRALCPIQCASVR